MLSLQVPDCRSVDAVHDCELSSLLTDTAASVRSRHQAVRHVLERLAGRVTLARFCGIVITMLRDLMAERDQLKRELNRRDLELERLEELRRVQGW